MPVEKTLAQQPINLTAVLAAVRKWRDTPLPEDADPAEHLNDALVPFGLFADEDDVTKFIRRSQQYMTLGDSHIGESDAVIGAISSVAGTLKADHEVWAGNILVKYSVTESGRFSLSVAPTLNSIAEHADELAALIERVIRAQVQ